MEEATIEDYLRALFLIYEKQNEEEKKQGIKSVDIANILEISKPSASEFLKKLAAEGLVIAEPYTPIQFTKKGLERAKEIIHTHRVIEVFLRDILNYDVSKMDSTIEAEAHKLEHAFSLESIKRLDKFLKNPDKCPHGNDIHN